jgi:hypothetical protein
MKVVTSFAMISCDVTSFATSCRANTAFPQLHCHHPAADADCGTNKTLAAKICWKVACGLDTAFRLVLLWAMVLRMVLLQQVATAVTKLAPTPNF